MHKRCPQCGSKMNLFKVILRCPYDDTMISFITEKLQDIEAIL